MKAATLVSADGSSAAFDTLDAWIRRNGWAGYDPYDIKEHPWIHYIEHRMPRTPLRRVANAVSSRIQKYTPVLVRRVMRVQPRVYAKGLGLMAQAYLTRHAATGDTQYLILAEKCLSWLRTHGSEATGFCWGYPFHWQSRVFIPLGTPSSVVTTTAGNAFWAYYQLTADNDAQETCLAVARFLATQLHQDRRADGSLCFSYTPLDQFHVHNANLMTAEFLIKCGRTWGNHQWVELGKRAVAYTLADQRSDGAFEYWGPEDREGSHVDHYHTGFVLRWLTAIHEHTGDPDALAAIKKCYSHYVSNLFGPAGEPRLTDQYPYPTDVHGCAEAILAPVRLLRSFPEGLDVARRSCGWTLNHMRSPHGWFYYRRDENGYCHKIPYLRWGQAWMLLALSRLSSVLERGMSHLGPELVP